MNCESPSVVLLTPRDKTRNLLQVDCQVHNLIRHIPSAQGHRGREWGREQGR